jgi:hypothetical protein
MDKVEAVRLALAELCDVPAAELVAFVERAYGVRIEARFLPVVKASIRGKDLVTSPPSAGGPSVLRPATALPPEA